MTEHQLIRRGFVSGLLVAVYVTLIVLGIFQFGKMDGPDNIVIPIAMLMLFVLSAAITGSLVLLKPIMLYFNGMKSEAVKLFMYTIGWIALFTVIAFAVMLGI